MSDISPTVNKVIILEEADRLLYANLQEHIKILQIERQCITGFTLDHIKKKYGLKDDISLEELVTKGKLSLTKDGLPIIAVLIEDKK